MTYLQFHLLFVVPPVVLLFSGVRRSLARLGRRGWPALWAVPLIALIYTTPWDAHLIRSGVWSYGEDRVLGALWGVPFEEYAFFVLQPLLTGMVFYRFLARLLEVDASPVLERSPRAVRRAGAALALAWVVTGLALLQRPEGTYMGLILVWAMPVIAGMWWWKGDLIWRWKAATIPGVIIPTVWFWIADRLAIKAEVWHISEDFTLGWNPTGLPVEEATFFLVTNMLVVAGLVLFLAPGLDLVVPSDALAQKVQEQSDHSS